MCTRCCRLGWALMIAGAHSHISVRAHALAMLSFGSYVEIVFCFMMKSAFHHITLRACACVCYFAKVHHACARYLSAAVVGAETLAQRLLRRLVRLLGGQRARGLIDFAGGPPATLRAFRRRCARHLWGNMRACRLGGSRAERCVFTIRITLNFLPVELQFSLNSCRPCSRCVRHRVARSGGQGALGDGSAKKSKIGPDLGTRVQFSVGDVSALLLKLIGINYSA